MDVDASAGDRHRQHFAGVNTRMLLSYLREHGGPGLLDAVLRGAGETRPLEELLSDDTWTSYRQFRRLLEVAGEHLGGVDQLAFVGHHAYDNLELPAYTDVLVDLGSPASLFAEIDVAAAGISPLLEVHACEAGPSEWVVHQRFKDGFEPFKAYCAYGAGILASSPVLYGLALARVVEEECQADGAPACRLRVTWEPMDETARRAVYYEARANKLEHRIDTLNAAVADLVSGDDLEEVLSRVLVAAAGVVRAPAYVLALDALPLAAKRVYAVGMDDEEAAATALLLPLSAPEDAATGRLVVEVASTRGRYGHLAAVYPDGAFFPQEHRILESFGRLAATALDSAVALEEARRQAAVAQALLDLSLSLTEICTTHDLAGKLAKAVPAVVDCDWVFVGLLDEDKALHFVAAEGCPPAVDAMARALRVPARPGEQVPRHTVYHGPDSDHPMVRRFMAVTGAVGVTSTPIVDEGERVGVILTAVTGRPTRLRGPSVNERLRALAGQAGTALRNTRLVEQIRHQALHDALTSLPNRSLILDRAEQMLGRARRDGTPVAALFIDLDGFKDVNDTLGHGAGDQLLRAVAGRLAGALGESDTIGRMGGDEFVVLVEAPSLGDGVGPVADRLLHALRRPFVLEGFDAPPVNVSGSIGIATGQRSSASELLRDADVALYEAKGAGKNRYVLFEPHMQAAVRERMVLEMDVRSALGNNQFSLVYQPIFDLSDHSLLGVEALLRWRHPTRGPVPPDVFIPLLEDNGLINEVGRWVLDQACTQTARWLAQGRRVAVSVNASIRQLEHPSFVGDVRGALVASGLPAELLTIEVTETAVMRDVETAAASLRLLKAVGVRVAIDDFGTGYSSMAYLRHLPVDAIKIDRSFVAAIADSPESSALIHTLVQLGKALGVETVAEGIEMHQQYRHLQRERCDSGQGFLFGQPLDVDAVTTFIFTHAENLAAVHERYGAPVPTG